MTYTPTEHSSANAKERFAKKFKRFVETGYKWTQFPKWFYIRLSMTFGHIAHYDRQGFFATWFQSKKDIKIWEKRIMYWKAFGDPAYTYSDVERDLSKWLGEQRGVEVEDHERLIILG